MAQREARVRCEAANVTFRLRRLAGREELGRLYRYDLVLTSPSRDVGLGDLLGKRLGVEVEAHGGTKRWFHGFIADALYLGTELDQALYHVAVVPWLWFLDRGADCRIFQQKTVIQIVEAVFARWPIADYTKRRLGEYPERDYCVQYRESDFNFVSRILEDEGLYYYFEHTENGHTLVLIDDVGNHEPRAQYKTIRYYPPDDLRRRERDHLDTWQAAAAVRPGKATLKDFDFENPSSDLTSLDDNPKSHALAKAEVYDYPGGYVVLKQGDDRARVRREALQATYGIATAEGNAAGLACGYGCTTEGIPREDQNIDYLLAAVESRLDLEEGRSGGGAAGDAYRCRLNLHDLREPFRPERITRKPFVQGPQTAIVTGPGGEEIYTDKYGRVKVQFHWDREGKKDEKSSCWIRVSQAWAGGGYGSIHIPRIGQEVIVDFLEGDPDRPIITGRVYNAMQMPPYGLPGGAVNSGIKSNSTKGGGGSNELKFDDTKGNELVYFHAQYNSDAVVENDKTETVHHDETIRIDNNRTETVGVNETLTVGSNRTRNVGANESVSVGSNQTVTVGSNRVDTVALNEARTVGIAQQMTIGAARNVTVGATQSHQVKINDSWKVGVNRSADIGANDSLEVGKDRSGQVGANDTLSVGKDQTITVSQNQSVTVSKTITITAGDEITIKTGSALINMKKNGDIVIKGKNILIDGSGKIDIKADGNITQKGQKILQN